MTHLFCGVKGLGASHDLTERTDVLIETTIGGTLPDTDRRCKITQVAKGITYDLGHAHYELNYCHRVAERIVKRRQHRGMKCFGTVGMSNTDAQAVMTDG